MTNSQSTNMKNLPFGLWPSPITPEMIGQALRLQDVQWAKDGSTLVWCQSLSGKASIFAKPDGEAPYDLTGTLKPGGGVGYGGGEFIAGSDAVIFADRNGRLYRRGFGTGAPKPITPAFGSVASPSLSPNSKWVAFVHTYEGQDVLGLVDAKGNTWPEKLVSGADFYMQPVWSPKGDALAWVEWDHPNMPWDGTRLMFAILAGDKPTLVESHQIDGDKDIPVLQPEFSPDGRYISYITNKGEWDQLVVMDLFTAEKTVLVKDKVLLKPAWVQGVRVHAWARDSQSIFFIENKQGSTLLRQVKLKSAEVNSINLQPYTNVSQISISPNGKLALFAQSSTIPSRLITISDGKIEIITRSQSESINPGDLSQPQLIDWKASDGMQVYGIYYPPTNSHFTSQGLPPVVVYIHGGPTSQVMTGYNLDTAFFTSRGYGYLAVNYRGSTGYGRNYMLALRHRWGEVDTIDAAEGAKALIGMGLADPDKLIIKGGSAGGYTVLNSLIHYPGLFKAGLCSYGVSNLFTLEMDTHKFEAHYNASLVGKLPEAAKRFHDWSPVFHAEAIKDPIAVFQGADDKVVPQEQSETIVAALQANGVPHEYHLYEGEGHGFRKTETLISYYKDIDRFLKQYVIFSV